MIKYPNGQNLIFSKFKNHKSKVEISISSANRGMSLEADINFSNEYYSSKGMCLVTKRPTPINVVKVDYSKGARITDAYFEKQSTTDYNGVYKGRYLDFEAKSTKLKTSFPLSNISYHQIEHLEKVLFHNGIAFFIVEFSSLDEIYLLDAKFVIDFYKKSERKSIPYDIFKKEGILVERNYMPRLDYLKAVDVKYFAK